jgi:hypothetical protein
MPVAAVVKMKGSNQEGQIMGDGTPLGVDVGMGALASTIEVVAIPKVAARRILATVVLKTGKHYQLVNVLTS